MKIRIHSFEIGCWIRWERYSELNFAIFFLSKQFLWFIQCISCIHAYTLSDYMVHSTVGCFKYFFHKRNQKLDLFRFDFKYLYNYRYFNTFNQSSSYKWLWCKSLSEALILASTNPQYDKRLFIVYTTCVELSFLVLNS